MRKVKYIAVVTSIGNRPLNHVHTNVRVGQSFDVDWVDFSRGRIFFKTSSGSSTNHRLLSGCAHLDGGSYKLMPYYVED